MTDDQVALGRTQEQLLESAVRLFFEQGYAQTSLQQVVDDAGLTKGAFYHYFSSKEEILQLIHDSYLDEELARAKAVVELGLGAAETVRALIRAMLETVAAFQDQMTIFLRERNALSGEHMAAVRAKRDEFEQIVTAVIERGVREGEFRPTSDVRLIAFAIMGMCAWAHEWYRPGGQRGAEDIAQLYGDLVLDGLVET
jgi:AcrR family transcriptional regulator